MADRIVVLQSGVVQQYDTPEVVYDRPANQFVAGFIGSPTMNFFSVELRGEAATFSDDGGAAPLDAAARARLRAAAGKAVLGVRPEHFDVAPENSTGIPVAIKLVEPLGSDTLVHFDMAGVSAIARINPALKPKPGERLSLLPQADKIHLFDTATGRILP